MCVCVHVWYLGAKFTILSYFLSPWHLINAFEVDHLTLV